MRKLTVFTVLCALALPGCGDKDACLDQGGRYHETTGQCEK